MAYFHTTVLDNQIKALPTVSTASGSVATFDTDMTENLVSCVCQLPYKANGYEEITINHNSVNIWNEQWEVGTFDNTTGEKQPYNNYWRSKTKIKVVPDTTYFCFSSNDVIYCYTYDINGNYIDFFRIGNNDPFTTDSTVHYINIVNVSRNDKTGYPVSINYPSTETSYNTFKGVYTEFPSIIYGGNIEAISGTLTSTYESDGTEKVTPDIIRCNGGQIVTLDNETNNIYNDCGDTEVKYLLTVGKKIS